MTEKKIEKAKVKKIVEGLKNYNREDVFKFKPNKERDVCVLPWEDKE